MGRLVFALGINQQLTIFGFLNSSMAAMVSISGFLVLKGRRLGLYRGPRYMLKKQINMSHLPLQFTIINQSSSSSSFSLLQPSQSTPPRPPCFHLHYPSRYNYRNFSALSNLPSCLAWCIAFWNLKSKSTLPWEFFALRVFLIGTLDTFRELKTPKLHFQNKEVSEKLTSTFPDFLFSTSTIVLNLVIS